MLLPTRWETNLFENRRDTLPATWYRRNFPFFYEMMARLNSSKGPCPCSSRMFDQESDSKGGSHLHNHNALLNWTPLPLS